MNEWRLKNDWAMSLEWLSSSVSQFKTLPHRIVHPHFQLFYIQFQRNLHKKFFDLTQNKYSIMMSRFAKFELKRPSWSYLTVFCSADKLTLLNKTKTITNRRWPDLVMFGQKRKHCLWKWRFLGKSSIFLLKQIWSSWKTLSQGFLSCVNCQNVKLFVI